MCLRLFGCLRHSAFLCFKSFPDNHFFCLFLASDRRIGVLQSLYLGFSFSYVIVSCSFLHTFLNRSGFPASPLPRHFIISCFTIFVSVLPAISSCILSLPFGFVNLFLLLFLRVLVLDLPLRVVLLVLDCSTPSRSSYVLFLPALLLQSPPFFSASCVHSSAGYLPAASALHTLVMGVIAALAAPFAIHVLAIGVVVATYASSSVFAFYYLGVVTFPYTWLCLPSVYRCRFRGPLTCCLCFLLLLLFC